MVGDLSPTKLLEACKFGDIEAVKNYLMEPSDSQPGSRDLEAKDQRGYAVGADRMPITELLVEDLNCVDKAGNSSVHYAAGYGRQEILTYLLGQKANVNKENSSQSLNNSRGQTPLAVAIKNEQPWGPVLIAAFVNVFPEPALANRHQTVPANLTVVFIFGLVWARGALKGLGSLCPCLEPRFCFCAVRYIPGCLQAMDLLAQPWIRGPPASRDELQSGDKVFLRQADRWEPGTVVGIDAANQSVHVKLPFGVYALGLTESARLLQKAARLLIVAPGAGVKTLGARFRALGAEPGFQVEVAGRKGVLYDRYPETWDTGVRAPNLRSFAEDLVRMGVHRRADCLIFGSRGGQVVLPLMWSALGDEVPPSVVVNGGCAMQLPGPPVRWPLRAVTVMLLGGQDFFRGNLSAEEYMTRTCQSVNPANRTTAFFYVPEMKHMPQESVVQAALPCLVEAALDWAQGGHAAVMSHLRSAQEALIRIGFGGVLRFTGPSGWQEQRFGPQVPDRPPAPLSPRAPKPARPPCPPGTAVSILPVDLAAEDSPESHRHMAAEARRFAAARPGSDPVRTRLLEWADGQDAEAWAAEDDAPKSQPPPKAAMPGKPIVGYTPNRVDMGPFPPQPGSRIYPVAQQRGPLQR
ncbi:AKR2A [Symbiodinium natans]|uniref:AKR2A protein n=1 Tax=Symbiodinium natans TaxID=878477 RepID=A0A812I7D0_9DINO|nr:AKR2A [Symbiodinium natans]